MDSIPFSDYNYILIQLIIIPKITFNLKWISNTLINNSTTHEMLKGFLGWQIFRTKNKLLISLLIWDACCPFWTATPHQLSIKSTKSIENLFTVIVLMLVKTHYGIAETVLMSEKYCKLNTWHVVDHMSSVLIPDCAGNGHKFNSRTGLAGSTV